MFIILDMWKLHFWWWKIQISYGLRYQAQNVVAKNLLDKK